MAECPYCDQEMTASVGCTAYPGRIPAEGKCHDCHAPAGTLHHPGCDGERCDHGNQAIGDCPDCDDYRHLPECPRSEFRDGAWFDCEGCGPDAQDYWERVGGAESGRVER